MNKETYSIFSPEKNIYYFESNGVNGVIIKAVAFMPFIDLENTYNLALLDYDSSMDNFSDMANSNNGDIGLIMATVIKIIDNFLNNNTLAIVFFEGNSDTKKRLYNRIVRNYHTLFQNNYEIRGSINELTEAYNSKRNYESFYVNLKS